MSDLRQRLAAMRAELLHDGDGHETFIAMLDTAIGWIDFVPANEAAAVEDLIVDSFAKTWARILAGDVAPKDVEDS